MSLNKSNRSPIPKKEIVLWLDLGNTRLKWLLGESAGRHQRGILVHEKNHELLFSTLVPLLEKKPGKIVLVNTAGALGALLADRLNATVPVATLSSVEKFQKWRSAYAHPASLGADRFANMLGAIAGGHSASLVVSMGTAITCDLLDRKWVHRGGLIAPGYWLAQHAVFHGTASVRAHVVGSVTPFARNTADGVASGALLSICGLIEHAAANARKILRIEPTVILCGADAGLVRPHLQISSLFEPDLTFAGMRFWLDHRAD
jgi:type III pantothenate kinase